MEILERSKRDLKKADAAGEYFLKSTSSRHQSLVPFAHSLPEQYHEVWIYVGGWNSDRTWSLAKWRNGAKLPVLLVPSGADPLTYRWPNLRGAEALLIYLSGAPLETAPRLALKLFESNAAIVRVLDTDKGRLTVYRRNSNERVAA